jgi:hypothetical protein
VAGRADARGGMPSVTVLIDTYNYGAR